MDFERCSDAVSAPLIPVSERGRKFTLVNTPKNRILKVRVDGCLIDDHRPRCDYLFELGQTCYCAIYVELKGKDINHAYEQLSATMGYLKTRHRTVTKIGHIVSSRVPKAGPGVQTLQSRMRKEYKALLFVGTREVKVDISSSDIHSQ